MVGCWGVGAPGDRAGRAVDALTTLVVQGVVRHVVGVDVFPHARDVPVRERVELQEAGAGVPLRRLDLRRRGIAAGAPAADPRVEPDLGAAQRPGLARLAALQAQELAVAELVDAVVRDHLLHLGRVGTVHAHAEAVALVGAVDELVGLGVQAAGVEREDRDAEAARGDHVRQDLVLGAQGGGESDAARVPRGRVGQDLLGGQALEPSQDVGNRLVDHLVVSSGLAAGRMQCTKGTNNVCA